MLTNLSPEQDILRFPRSLLHPEGDLGDPTKYIWTYINNQRDELSRFSIVHLFITQFLRYQSENFHVLFSHILSAIQTKRSYIPYELVWKKFLI